MGIARGRAEIAMVSARQGQADPRLLRVQVERAAKAVRTSATGSPLWVCFFAAICSKLTPFLGQVSPVRSIAVVLIVMVAAGLAQLALHFYRRSANDLDTISQWRLRLLGVSIVVSAAWGSAPWLLWDEVNNNHSSARWDEEALMRFSHEDMSRELEEARDEALRKRAEAETANASKTSFLANMSHELRTPLNAILGFSEIIARECLGPVGSQRYKEYAGDIHISGSHLLSLINDLLDVAKIEAGRMEVEPQMIETARCLDGALKFVGPKARERNQSLTIRSEERRVGKECRSR